MNVEGGPQPRVLEPYDMSTGIETPFVRPPGLSHDSEDSRSAGSFEFLGEAADEKTCGGSP